mmetsp:Transcript_124934/g.220067  ORF Transcript_124934/g.220067 Transcript_124934/m.220067 type:complete len:266 (-) Transcript_124934:74-871(-)
MRAASLVLACLVCASYGHKVHRGSSIQEHQVFDSFTALSKILLAFASPGVGRQAIGYGEHPSAPFPQNVLHRRVPETARSSTRMIDSEYLAKFKFRPGSGNDVGLITGILLQQLTNPLQAMSTRPEDFLVVEDMDGERVGFGRIRAVDENMWELSSIFVEPDYRRRGLGSEIVRRLLASHKEAEGSLNNVYVLGSSRYFDFYRGLGFKRVAAVDVPPSLRFEVVAGTAIEKVAGARKECFKYAYDPIQDSPFGKLKNVVNQRVKK